MGYEFDFTALSGNVRLLLHGAGVTLALTAVTASLGVVLGVAGAAGMLWGGRWLRRIITAYVELIRNTPFLVQLFFIFFGLPALGLRLSATEAAALAMVVNLTAYGIEIIRAGLACVPEGQREAGRALGLRPGQIFRKIILPQGLAATYPALVSQIVLTMLESAVVSQIAVTDLTHAGDLIQSISYRAFETYFVITLIYLALALSLRWALRRAGRVLFAGRAV